MRALITGPGAPAGVSYLVHSVRAAEALVDGLNLVLLYARELKAARAARRTRKRKIS